MNLERKLIETVEQGEISYYHYDDLNFTGVDLLIKNQQTWQWFWALHTAGRVPAGREPQIDFGKEMVIVTILGTQRTGGGPSTQVLEVNTGHRGQSLHVLIRDDETPGLLQVITNPFHIIKLEKLPDPSVVFEHHGPEVPSTGV
jgi:hypothetical protein